MIPDLSLICLARIISNISIFTLVDAMRSGSIVSIVTQGSDDLGPTDSPTIDPPALTTLVLSNCKIGNATMEKVSIRSFLTGNRTGCSPAVVKSNFIRLLLSPACAVHITLLC